MKLWTITHDKPGTPMRRRRVLGYRRACRTARSLSMGGESFVARKRWGRLSFQFGPLYANGVRDD